MNTTCVVVGTQVYQSYYEEAHERERVARVIEEQGYAVVRTFIPWPRDHYVFYDGRYVIKKEFKDRARQGCGEGGYFQLAQDFVLVSERVLGISEDHECVAYTVGKQYPGKRVHVVPVGYQKRRTYDQRLDHIDLSCLLIPSRKLLLADKSLYQSFAAEVKHVEPYFQKIAEQESLLFVWYEPEGTARNLFPLNCLVLPKENDEIVFANKNAPCLTRLLQTYDLAVIEVDVQIAPQMSLGSIRCITNTKDNRKTLVELVDTRRRELT